MLWEKKKSSRKGKMEKGEGVIHNVKELFKPASLISGHLSRLEGDEGIPQQLSEGRGYYVNSIQLRHCCRYLHLGFLVVI